MEVFCSVYRKNLKLYEFYIPAKILPFKSNAKNISLYLEVVAQTCSARKVFLEISQNL